MGKCTSVQRIGRAPDATRVRPLQTFAKRIPMTESSLWSPSIDRQSVDLVMRLMAIAGKSGEEGKVAEAIKRFLRDMGVPDNACEHDAAHRRSPLRGEIGNLFVHLPGNSRLPRIMLSAHMDTVPICVGCQPKRKGGTIVSALPATGLGADDRAGVAAALMAAKLAWETLDQAARPPVTLCFFVQEEVGLHGSRFMSATKAKRPGLALNFDGGNPRKLTIGATGGERMKIRLQGIPAHAGLAPREGASAITAAGLAIADLYRKKWLGAVRKPGGRGTSNIGVIHGGAATNVVAEQVELAAEARSHDNEFRTRVADAIEQAFVDAAARVVNDRGDSVRAIVERRVDYESFRLDPESPAVQTIRQAIERLGESPELAVSDGGVDANWTNRHGIPTVTVGCGQRNVHTTNESLDIPDFLFAIRLGFEAIRAMGQNVAG